MEQISTRDRIKELLLERPHLSIAGLVPLVGITRQRIHQILKQEGLKAGNGRDPEAITSPKPRIRTSSVVSAISTTACGTVSELIVAADLTARGWHVFFPLVRFTQFDLIASSRDGTIITRIEVRSANLKNNKISFLKRERDHLCDHYALVIADQPVTYEPDLPNVSIAPKAKLRPKDGWRSIQKG